MVGICFPGLRPAAPMEMGPSYRLGIRLCQMMLSAGWSGERFILPASATRDPPVAGSLLGSGRFQLTLRLGNVFTIPVRRGVLFARSTSRFASSLGSDTVIVVSTPVCMPPLDRGVGVSRCA